MSEPRWISLKAVRTAHEQQLAINGGSSGIRDGGGLISALMRARNKFLYEPESSDMASLAAAYAFGICSNHPFVDGNKRAAFLAMYMFLRLNGYTFSASEAEVVHIFLSLASSETSESDPAAWIRANIGKD